jgi:hypothetical protein
MLSFCINGKAIQNFREMSLQNMLSRKHLAKFIIAVHKNISQKAKRIFAKTFVKIQKSEVSERKHR